MKRISLLLISMVLVLIAHAQKNELTMFSNETFQQTQIDSLLNSETVVDNTVASSMNNSMHKIGQDNYSAMKYKNFADTVSPEKNYAYYMKWRKKNNKTGLKILGYSAAAFLLGAFVMAKSNEIGWGGIMLAITSCYTALVSIPFFIIARSDYKKAMRLSVQNQTGYELQGNKIGANSMLALSLKIQL